jgi:hypothetical protein
MALAISMLCHFFVGSARVKNVLSMCILIFFWYIYILAVSAYPCFWKNVISSYRGIGIGVSVSRIGAT